MCLLLFFLWFCFYICCNYLRNKDVYFFDTLRLTCAAEGSREQTARNQRVAAYATRLRMIHPPLNSHLTVAHILYLHNLQKRSPTIYFYQFTMRDGRLGWPCVHRELNPGLTGSWCNTSDGMWLYPRIVEHSGIKHIQNVLLLLKLCLHGCGSQTTTAAAKRMKRKCCKI